VESNVLNVNGGRKVAKFFVNYALYMLIIGLVIVYASLTPLFLSGQNIVSLLTNSAPLLVAAVGMTLILIIAEIDLSIGSIAGVVASLWILMLTQTDMNIVLATIVAIAVGAAIGVLNAVLIVGLRINSFLATLGMQIFLRGFVFIFTNGAQILMTDAVKQANAAMKNVLFGLSPLLVFGLLIAIAMMLVYRYTAFGRKVQAVGCNKAASVKLGINVKMVTALCFVICGALAGVAGILTATNVGMVHPSNIGSGMEFLAITACVLGGTSLLGGTGSIIPGTLIGVIFLNSIENGLGLLGASAYAYPVVRGLVIYLAMLTDSFKHSMFVNK
jgi:ribose/xylose/arabinose/galactoside ABC-type transport system permease subunit